MIAYQMVGTNKYNEALAFYDALLGEMGAKRMMEEENVFVAWGTSPEAPAFCVCHPNDKQAATVGNGVMTAFGAENPQAVDKLYAKAMSLGATCEGEPGPRGDSGFYAGYCRDLDGNKFNFFCVSESSS